ncbi:MAG: glucosamine-6-phosphate deaminase [Verrucomicrobiales bacterium]|jgi:glucosamine-6-phosphate deaminase
MSIIDSSGRVPTAEERFERVRTVVFKNSAEPSRQLAKEVADLIRERAAAGQNAVLGLATGSTPVPFYRELIRLHKEEGLSFKNVISFNLDEYHGLEPDHKESYSTFMHDQLFDHIDIPAENVNIPNGMVPPDEVFDWCQGYETQIDEAGGLDLQILGIGRTGHIGFNEPGSTADSITRMITLDRITRRDAASDFLGEENVPRFAITMGVGTIMKAKRVVLMAWGENKAEITRQAAEEDITDRISASFLQAHENATFVVDQSGGSRLTRFHSPWMVRSVEWEKRTTRKAVLWLAEKLGKPILKLIDEEYNENGMAELLTRHGAAYHVNISVFNQLQHTITGWPGGKPNVDDANRPERAEPPSKRILVLSPEPQDAIVSMGGTLERMIKQGHQIKVVCQTSGNLRVADAEAHTFAGVLSELAAIEANDWSAPQNFSDLVRKQLLAKGPFGIDPPDLRQLKGLILRGEARDANEASSVQNSRVRFLDLPFYEQGRYRRFQMTEADVDAMTAEIDEFKPHLIFATGHVADPSSLQSLCFQALSGTLERTKDADWRKDCRVWVYRGKEKPLEAHEIDMAVPLSPDQLLRKVAAIHKFQAIRPEESEAADGNRAIAKRYDILGMAEYEAIEAFQRWA